MIINKGDMKRYTIKKIASIPRHCTGSIGDEYGDFPDEHYMVLLQQGDFSVLQVLIDRYHQYVLNRFKHTGNYSDEAEELTHEIFIKVLENRLSYMPERSKFKTWLTTIVLNLNRDHYKRKKQTRSLFYFTSDLEIPEINNDPSYSETDFARLEKAMSNLSQEQLTIIYLSKYKDYPYEKIAAMLKLSVANVKVKVHRTICHLKTLYADTEKIA